MKKILLSIGSLILIISIAWLADLIFLSRQQYSEKSLSDYVFQLKRKPARQISSDVTEKAYPENEMLNTYHSGLNAEVSKQINSYKKLTPQMVKIVNEINEIQKCYGQDCFGETDGLDQYQLKTQYFKIGQKAKSKMLILYQMVQTEEYKSEDIVDFAIEQLKQTDGHIQEVALDLLSTQNPTKESLTAIIDSIIHGQDPTLIRQGLLELSRYQNTNDQIYIQNEISQGILHGSPIVSEALSEHAHIYINNRNVGFYEKVVESLLPTSRVRKNLLFTIQEINRKNQS